MTCREVAEFLMAYASGELAPEPRRVFDAHLDACPQCRLYVESYDRAVAAAKDAYGSDAPTDAPEELVAAILAARTRQR